jgi:dTDP-4-dehydrorhamnose reductase
MPEKNQTFTVKLICIENRMKILLFGPNGQVGWELQRSLAPLGALIALDRRSRNGLSGDLTDENGLREAIQVVNPDVIVNAAAYTSVDQAESEPMLARTVNVRAPEIMAQEVRKINAMLIHYSTDYVFDGTGNTAWREDDVPNPMNVYGQTKLEGEEAVVSSGCRYLIFRTSWVYAARGRNFLHTILNLAACRDQLQVVNDQIGAPTGAELIADVTSHALRSLKQDCSLSGRYHLAAAGETSWWGYARFILEQAITVGHRVIVQAEGIHPVSSLEFPTLAKRPGNSRLDTSCLEQTFGLHLPDWKDGVAHLIRELKRGM